MSLTTSIIVAAAMTAFVIIALSGAVWVIRCVAEDLKR